MHALSEPQQRCWFAGRLIEPECWPHQLHQAWPGRSVAAISLLRYSTLEQRLQKIPPMQVLKSMYYKTPPSIPCRLHCRAALRKEL